MITIILGTAREDRQSENVARYVLEYFKNQTETQLVDVRDHPLSATEKGAFPEWQKIAEESDGFVIVSPEYNHGYPGELKLFLDTLQAEYSRKPVGVIGVSAGNLGGARVVEQLKLTALGMGMVPIYGSVYFSGVYNLFDKEGNCLEKEVYNKRLDVFREELLWFTETLKNGKVA